MLVHYFAIIMCLHNIDVNICRGRAVTNVGRTCDPTPLLEFIDAIKYVYTIYVGKIPSTKPLGALILFLLVTVH